MIKQTVMRILNFFLVWRSPMTRTVCIWRHPMEQSPSGSRLPLVASDPITSCFTSKAMVDKKKKKRNPRLIGYLTWTWTVLSLEWQLNCFVLNFVNFIEICFKLYFIVYFILCYMHISSGQINIILTEWCYQVIPFC